MMPPLYMPISFPIVYHIRNLVEGGEAREVASILLPSLPIQYYISVCRTLMMMMMLMMFMVMISIQNGCTKTKSEILIGRQLCIMSKFLTRLSDYLVRPRGTSGQTFASHRWGPEFASRSLHVGFVVDETGTGQIFRGVSPVFLYQKFHSTISPHSSHPFRSVFSALVMVRKAWSAGTLATHGPIFSGLHRISSLDPILCWTRVEDIYLFIYLIIS